jgi:hypothetical protein
MILRAYAILLLAASAFAQGPDSRPCSKSLAQCPPVGCAEPGTPTAAANRIRRTWPGTTPPRLTLTVDELEALQVRTDDDIRQGFAIADRRVLREIGTKGGIRYGEGDVVDVRGFIVGTPHRRRTDSANCNRIGINQNNFRLHLASDPADTEFDSIIAELSPFHRPQTWTLPKLRKLQQEGRLLLVRGQLFYNSKHYVNNDPDAELPREPRRLALWELHPVTQILVCTARTNDCRPEDTSAWEPLASYD